MNRRNFLHRASMGAVLAALPSGRVWGQGTFDPAQSADWLHERRETFPAIAAAALDAARRAGARYADIHFRTTHTEGWLGAPSWTIRVGVGVRAVVNGYWGFAAHDGVLSRDGAEQVGRSAARQAAIAARGKAHVIELAPAPVATGTWVTPIEIDPFTVSFEEKADFRDAMTETINRIHHVGSAGVGFAFMKEERTFASSEGAFTTQTIYTTSSGFSVSSDGDPLTGLAAFRTMDELSIAGAGWEYVRNAPIQDRAETLLAQALGARRPKPVEIGRYDIVFDAKAMASVLDQTIVMATELDRAMGYEANDVGTSFLNDPMGMLGNYKMGSPLVNLTANRSMKGGAATVKWDDEGVEPQDFTLVKDGILTDFQTTREAATWIAPYYQRTGTPVRSNGCAGVCGTTNPPQQVSPNVVLHPGREELSFDDLVKTVKKGLAVVGGGGGTDWQALNGSSRGEIVYEIVDGTLQSTVNHAEIVYRSPEFWQNVAALGGSRSAQRFGLTRSRENFFDRWVYTISAVPAVVRNVAVTDFTRKV